MSFAALCPQIIMATVGDDDLIKEVDFSGPVLASGETISSIGTISIFSVDSAWRNPAVSTDITVQSNGSSGTVAQLLLSGLTVAGRYIIVVPGITSEGQTLVAECRLLLELGVSPGD